MLRVSLVSWRPCQGLAARPAQDDVAAVEHDGNAVEAFGQPGELTSLGLRPAWRSFLREMFGPLEQFESRSALVQDICAGSKEMTLAVSAVIEGGVDHRSQRLDVDAEVVEFAHVQFCAATNHSKRKSDVKGGGLSADGNPHSRRSSPPVRPESRSGPAESTGTGHSTDPKEDPRRIPPSQPARPRTSSFCRASEVGNRGRP